MIMWMDAFEYIVGKEDFYLTTRGPRWVIDKVYDLLPGGPRFNHQRNNGVFVGVSIDKTLNPLLHKYSF